MELGNMIFGNSRGEHEIDRGYQSAFYHEVLEKMGFDGCGYPEDELPPGWTQEGNVRENEDFAIFPYYWGDCTCGEDLKEDGVCTPDCLLNKPNMVVKPLGVEIQWYKYPLRDAYCNKPFDSKLLAEIVALADKYATSDTTEEEGV